MKIDAHPPNQIQDLFRVILLEPKESLNIGSVARAMMNLGFSELAIVSARNLDFEKAAITARRAKVLVEQALVFDSLEEAISSCTYIAGFSTKDSKNTPPVQMLDTWATSLETIIKVPNAKIGLLFGPEDTGLRYEHLPCCHALVRIPSYDEYDSLNLAQAAMLVFYVIAARSILVKEERGKQELAAIGEQFSALDALIQKIALKAEFITEGTPENTMLLLQNLFRRPQLTHREMQILLGFFSRIAKS